MYAPWDNLQSVSVQPWHLDVAGLTTQYGVH